jgi:hypothetical protein
LRRPFGASPLLRDGVAADVAGRTVPLCELLLDCYLDFGERLPDEQGRNRAQEFAAGPSNAGRRFASSPIDVVCHPISAQEFRPASTETSMRSSSVPG